MRETREETKKICPKCGKEYKGYPAISREDNATPICPQCGTRESLESLGVSKEEYLSKDFNKDEYILYRLTEDIKFVIDIALNPY